MDNKEELFPLVDEQGNVIGKIKRGEAHNGSFALHPVVHLHVFNSKGELYLQHRPAWKDIQPDKWDTAVGGHVNYGESIEQALAREAKEELGLSDFRAEFIGKYIFKSTREREFVNSYKTIVDEPIMPNKEELGGGRFWSIDEIKQNIGKNNFTPNFEEEFLKILVSNLSNQPNCNIKNR